MKNKILQLKKYLKSAKTLNIVTHVDPDGDAIGSSVLMAAIAGKINPKLKITKIIDPKHQEHLDYFIDKYKFTAVCKPADITISVDASNAKRIAPAPNSAITINIDHHIDNEKFGSLNIIDPKAAATGVILYQLLKALKIKIDPKIAECLYLTISSDTGNFSFSNTDQTVFEAAFKAVSAGALPNRIYSQLNEQLSLGEIKTFGACLAATENYFNGKLIISAINKNDPIDNRFLIDFIRREKNASVAVVLVEKADHIKVSLRSKDNTDVSKIAGHFNGGGHRCAASGKIFTDSLNNAKKTVLEYFQEHVF